MHKLISTRPPAAPWEKFYLSQTKICSRERGSKQQIIAAKTTCRIIWKRMLTNALDTEQLIKPYSTQRRISVCTAVNGLFTYSTVHDLSEKKKTISVMTFYFTMSLNFAGNVHLKLNLTFLLLTVKSNSSGNAVVLLCTQIFLFTRSHCLKYENPEAKFWVPDWRI